MASGDANIVPQKNVAYRVTFPIFDSSGDLDTGATSPDSERSIDGGTFADCSNEATEIATNSGMYFLDLNASEMNGDTVALIIKSGGKTTPIVLYPTVGDYEEILSDITALSTKQDSDMVIVASDTTINTADIATLSTKQDSDMVVLNTSHTKTQSDVVITQVDVAALSTKQDSDMLIVASDTIVNTTDIATLSTKQDSDMVLLDSDHVKTQSDIVITQVAVAALSTKQDSDMVIVASDTTINTTDIATLSTKQDSDMVILDSDHTKTQSDIAIISAGSGLTPLTSGTAQAATDSTIRLAASAAFADDIMNGNVILILTGTGAGQSRVITDYALTNDVATVTPNWITNPSSDSTYEVWPGSANVVGVSNVAEDLPTATALAAVSTKQDSDMVIVASDTTINTTDIATLSTKQDSDMVIVASDTTINTTDIATLSTKQDSDMVIVASDTTINTTDIATLSTKLGSDMVIVASDTIVNTTDIATLSTKQDSDMVVLDADHTKTQSDIALIGASSGDWSSTERENIRQALGVDGTKTAGGSAGDLQDAQGATFNTTTDSLEALRNRFDASVAPSLTTQAASSLLTGTFIAGVTDEVRRYTDEPAVNAKWNDSDILAKVHEAWAEIYIDVTFNSEWPVIVKVDISWADGETQIMLPPNVGQIIEVAKITDDGSRQVIWEYAMRPFYDPAGWGVRVTGNTLELGAAWDGATEIMQMTYIPNGEIAMFDGSWSSTEDFSANLRTIVMPTTATNGQLPTLPNSLGGYMFRTIIAAGTAPAAGDPTTIQQEHLITAYNPVTRVATLATDQNPPLDINTYGTVTFEVVPILHHLLRGVVSVRAAQNILSAEGNKDRAGMLALEYRRKMRSLKLQVASIKGRRATRFEGGTRDDPRSRRNRWGY